MSYAYLFKYIIIGDTGAQPDWFNLVMSLFYLLPRSFKQSCQNLKCNMHIASIECGRGKMQINLKLDDGASSTMRQRRCGVEMTVWVFLSILHYFAPNLRRTCLVPYSHHQDHWWIAVYTPDCRVIVMCARANSCIALTWSHAANEWMIDWLHYFPTLFFIRAQKTRLTLFLPPFWICRSWKIVPPIAIHRQKIPTRPRPHNRSRIWGPNGKYRQQTNQTANLGYGRPRILPLHH